MYVLERKQINIFKNWKIWEAKTFFDSSNSKNPRLEALTVFENIKPLNGERWRVTSKGKLIIEHK